MCWTLNSIFENEGYNVHAVMTGIEALKEITKHRFDLIILDYMLPDMTGKGILKFLHSINLNITTIVVSAYGTPQIKSEALDLGATAFLNKPFKLQKLLKISETVLNSKNKLNYC